MLSGSGNKNTASIEEKTVTKKDMYPILKRIVHENIREDIFSTVIDAIGQFDHGKFLFLCTDKFLILDYEFGKNYQFLYKDILPSGEKVHSAIMLNNETMLFVSEKHLFSSYQVQNC